MKKVLEDVAFTFDDVLVVPTFSTVPSRREVDLSVQLSKLKLRLPILCSNMDTIVSVEMCHALASRGAVGVLHRFKMDPDQNAEFFKDSIYNNVKPVGSIGINKEEIERAEALVKAGCEMFCIDVANGAQTAVVNMHDALRKKFKNNIGIVVGNFATGASIEAFLHHSKTKSVDAFKVGIGGGSACTTRIKTGCGYPQLSAVLDCVATGQNIISDGGHNKPADICKSLAAGAACVMLGGMFSATDECPGEIISNEKGEKFKKYRGSASQESYEVQGKVSEWRTAEGESFPVPHKGSVHRVIDDIEGGIRSSLTYVDAKNLKEYVAKAQLIRVSSIAVGENGAHGKGK